MLHPFSERLIDVTVGARSADLVLRGGRVVDVCTGEIYPADIAVADGRIAFVGDGGNLVGETTIVHELDGRFVLPGFLDGHHHLEDSRLSVTGFSDAVVPAGTTGIVTGLDHVAAVAGPRGVRAFLDEARDCDLSVFWAAPFRLPYTVPAATTGARWTEAEHRETQSWPECIGVWELCPDFITSKDPDTLAGIRIARDRRLGVYGSVPWAGDPVKVAAHVAAGLVVDHEAYSQEELLLKLRMGLRVLIRDSPVEHFLPPLIGLFRERPELSHRAGFCTDQLSVRDVRANGHISRLVREAVAAGLPAVTAIQMATINTACIYRIDDLVGSITPGRRADLLIAEDLVGFTFTDVFVGGRHVARNGEMLIPSTPPPRPPFLGGSFPRPRVRPDEFEFRAGEFDFRGGGRETEALVISLTGNAFHRTGAIRRFPVVDGRVRPDADVAHVAYVERFGRTAGPPGLGLVSGFGLTRGAVATSCSPDDENILCVGRDAADMALAVNTLIDIGGGEIVVADGAVLRVVALPVGGIVCDLPPAQLAADQKELVASARALGCCLDEPFMFLGVLGITGIPDYGLSEHGVIEFATHAPVPVLRGGGALHPARPSESGPPR